MNIAFPLDAKARFTQERLSILSPRDRNGLAGRIGVIQTDGKFVRKPTVYFPTDGNKLELRLFRVDPSHLELVESPPSTEITPHLTHDSTDEASSTLDGSGNLSQSDLDKFF